MIGEASSSLATQSNNKIENIQLIKLYELLFELKLKDSNYEDALNIARNYLLDIYK
jgi:hypothetical protein